MMFHVKTHNQSGRSKLIFIIGLILFLYFSYYSIMGERSLPRLIALQSKNTELEQIYAARLDERYDLEKRVVSMRIETIDLDRLEEQAKILLGFHGQTEKILSLPSP